MQLRVSVTVVAALLSTAQWTSAQTLPSVNVAPAAIETVAADQSVLLPPKTPPSGVQFGAPAPRNPFTSLGSDLQRFFTSRDTRVIIGAMAPAAGVAHTWDQAGIRESQKHLAKPFFQPGNIGGSFLVQTSGALGTWAVGALSGHEKTTAVGSDLLRAQLVSQTIVQGVKLATRRERPDSSNQHSFPSGHTSSAFATATVLERHFGWKLGAPAYGFASYVALARMSANKHHMSDVIMGAAVGIAAGRAVTVGVGGAQFDMGVAPTRGGAAVTFTKR